MDAGRDVMSDLRPWQRQALGTVQHLAIKQGLRRRHPAHVLGQYNQGLFNGNNPRYKWEDAIRRSEELSKIPDVYAQANKFQEIPNQLGLVKTAHDNFKRSRERMSMCTPVGV